MSGKTLHIGWLLAATCLSLTFSGCSREAIQSSVDWGSISGQVRNASTERPVAGCIVTCAGRSAVIGGDGDYWLQDIPEGFHELSATCEGYEDYRVAVYIGVSTKHDIYITRAGLYGSLYGQAFLGEDTTPLAGVEVLCAYRTTYTDENGRYSFPSINNGRYTIRARKQNYLEYRHNIEVSGDTEHVLRMAATSLGGWVVNTVDGPVAGVTVTMPPSTTTTNEFGEFRLDIVPQGTHDLVCTHPDYNSTVMRISLAADQPDQMVRITRTVTDTIMIAEDASISSANYTDCEGCPDWGDESTNHGRDNALRLGWFMRPDQAASAGAWMARSRAILGLPDLPEGVPLCDLDRAIMILTPLAGASDGGYLSVRRVREAAADWIQTDITWSSAPEAYLVPYWIGSIDQVSYEVDVTAIYRDERDHLKSLVIQRDESGPAEPPRQLTLYSSEAQSPANSPLVEIQFTR
ncbi:MAG: carboxypeptidase regulatory-like domain-containing protein [bacterium]